MQIETPEILVLDFQTRESPPRENSALISIVHWVGTLIEQSEWDLYRIYLRVLLFSQTIKKHKLFFPGWNNGLFTQSRFQFLGQGRLCRMVSGHMRRAVYFLWELLPNDTDINLSRYKPLSTLSGGMRSPTTPVGGSRFLPGLMSPVRTLWTLNVFSNLFNFGNIILYCVASTCTIHVSSQWEFVKIFPIKSFFCLLKQNPSSFFITLF